MKDGSRRQHSKPRSQRRPRGIPRARAWSRSAAVLTLAAVPVLAAAQCHDPLPSRPVPVLLAGSDQPRSLPDAPTPQTEDAAAQTRTTEVIPGGAISGTVTDLAGDVLAGATVVLEGSNLPEKRTASSDENGFFSFGSLVSGRFKILVEAKGFAHWAQSDITLHVGQDYDMPPIVLFLESTTTNVAVSYSQQEVAEEQIAVQEKQRVLGIVPNFYTSYVWNAAPLSTRQKYKLAWRSIIDPFSFVAAGVASGFEQWDNGFSGYGQGAQGYAKRYGAAYADDAIGTFIGGAILPSLLHQDPRYYYKGTGSIKSRALYAMSTAFITKGDNGKWQPNYSNVLGNLAAGGISNLYYPASDRNGVSTTIDNALLGTIESSASALIQEFLLRHITPSARNHDH